MNVKEICFATIEEFQHLNSSIDVETYQLKPGRLDFLSKQVDLGDVQIQWNEIGASIHSHEVFKGTGLEFGFVLQSPTPFKSFGREKDYGSAVIWQPDQELEYIAPSGLTSLIISVKPDVIDFLGWQPSDCFWQPAPKPRLAKLEQVCRMATAAFEQRDASRTGKKSRPRKSQNTRWWRDQILSHLEATMAPWLEPQLLEKTKPSTHHFKLVKETVRLFGRPDHDTRINVDAIAESLGVSRRTVFHGFRTYLGMGPYAYLQLVRLHKLRDSLIASSANESTVTKLANDLGFFHMGRLSAAYHEHFGEYPHETLSRS